MTDLLLISVVICKKKLSYRVASGEVKSLRIVMLLSHSCWSLGQRPPTEFVGR